MRVGEWVGGRDDERGRRNEGREREGEKIRAFESSSILSQLLTLCGLCNAEARCRSNGGCPLLAARLGGCGQGRAGRKNNPCDGREQGRGRREFHDGAGERGEVFLFGIDCADGDGLRKSLDLERRKAGSVVAGRGRSSGAKGR